MLVQVAAGDREALSRLYGATSGKLFGVILRMVEDRADAEEVLQEVYIRIWGSAGRYRVIDLSPITWLVAVARNLAIDRIRQRKRTRAEPMEMAEKVADTSPSPEEAAVTASLRQQIALGLSTLPPGHASAVLRFYVHGDTSATIAARQQLPHNTVKTQLRRSLLKLRLCLEAESTPAADGSAPPSRLSRAAVDKGPRGAGEVPL